MTDGQVEYMTVDGISLKWLTLKEPQSVNKIWFDDEWAYNVGAASRLRVRSARYIIIALDSTFDDGKKLRVGRRDALVGDEWMA